MMRSIRFKAEEGIMKKRLVITFAALAVMLAGAVSAGAQLRLDIDINDPVYLGYSNAGTRTGVWNQYPYIPIPDAKLMYQLSLGPINLGGGVRVFSFIIENLMYPEIYGELDLSPFVLNVSVGGGAFLHFGLLSALANGTGYEKLNGFQQVILPDISVAYKLNDIFRLSGGVFIIAPFTSSLGGVLATNVFAGYIKATFVVKFR
jgi:hypothetical protein